MKLYEIIVKVPLAEEGQELTLLNTTKRSLKECAEELNITYQQAADISSKRWRPKSKYRFSPEIEINKIQKIIVLDNISTDINEERSSTNQFEITS